MTKTFVIVNENFRHARLGCAYNDTIVSPWPNLRSYTECVSYPPMRSKRSAKPRLDWKGGKKAHVTMHLLEGGEKEIRAQLEQSLDAFFEFYPEI